MKNHVAFSFICLVSHSIWVPSYAQLPQTIYFTSPAPTNAQIGGLHYVTATASPSNLPVTFSSGNLAVATVTGNTVNYVGEGTAIIHANQPGGVKYLPANQVTQTFTVSKIPQSISFPSIPSALIGDSYTLAATASSGLNISYSSGSPSVATVNGNTVSFIGSGQATIYANQAGNNVFQPAPQVVQYVTIAKLSQTVSFTSSPVSPTYGGTYYVSASATSGLVVQVTSGTPSVATVSGNIVTFVGTGTASLHANQPGNGIYNPASQVTQTFSIAKASQTISFASTPLAPSVGDQYFIYANATSGLGVAFSSGSPSVATVYSNVAIFVGAGTAIINANQAGNANYHPATQTSQPFTVSLGGGRLADQVSPRQESITRERPGTFRVYPNPAGQTLTIKLAQPTLIRTPLVIYNSTGLAILQDHLEKDTQEKELNTNNFPNGFYIIEVKTASGVVRKKTIVLH